ncbi:hypothetical protein [Methylobacterium sp. R2-1]|uniref:hypothetical protein n=1 Tax=Methylobacterium sp. R2-1 TaxID=2587064 RepID=UPI00161D9AB0|nr:hypothetical protein [Methylobacterium sp. R2-1]MBB2961905.1 hypothetical protein [Methylobacterium sp. R2-1]
MAMDWRQITNVGIAVTGLLMVVVLFYALWLNRFDNVVTQLVLKNFPIIIGLPFAFLAAFIVIALLRQGDGPLEFKGFGFEFKGASGEIILWLLCFLQLPRQSGLCGRTSFCAIRAY